MATAKQLVPGIHTLGKRLAWEGKTARPISVDEAGMIADKVCDSPVQDIIRAARAEIEAIVGIPFHMMAS